MFGFVWFMVFNATFDDIYLRNTKLENIIKMKNKKYHTVKKIQKSNIKYVERGKINTQIYDCSLSWLGTRTSIKVAGLNFTVIQKHRIIHKNVKG